MIDKNTVAQFYQHCKAARTTLEALNLPGPEKQKISGQLDELVWAFQQIPGVAAAVPTDEIAYPQPAGARPGSTPNLDR